MTVAGDETEPYPDLRSQAEHPTVPLPADLSSATAAPARRRRWPWVVGALVVVLAGAIVGGEFLARGIVDRTIREQVISALKLPADQQLEVETGGIMLAQLAAGRLDQVHLSSESITFGPLTGAVSVDAQGVPLRGGPLTGASGTLRISESEFTALLATADLPVTEIAIEEPNITAKGSFSVFGTKIPLALTLRPGADGGDITVLPVSLSIGELVLDAAQANERFGDLASGLTAEQRICIADQIPAGIHLTGLAIDGDDVIVDVEADPAITVDPALLENGTCPAR